MYCNGYILQCSPFPGLRPYARLEMLAPWHQGIYITTKSMGTGGGAVAGSSAFLHGGSSFGINLWASNWSLLL